MELKSLLQQLAETPGPSGFEGPISDTLRALWMPLVDEIVVDRVGTLVATKIGSGPEPRHRVVLAAHLDEIGLMVRAIESGPGGDGFLRVSPIGGVDRRQLHGQAVVVHGRQNGAHDLPGILAALPVSMLPAKAQGYVYSYDELVVDVGLPRAVLQEYVAVGDFVSFHQPKRSVQGKRVVGKAMDNRTSLAAVTLCLEALYRREHAWDVLAVATSQEETGLLGAHTSGHGLQPDMAVAVDVTIGAGSGATGPLTYELGKGPTIGFGPNVHPTVQKLLQEAAEALEMSVHLEPHARHSGTDAAALVLARAGIPTGIVGIPLRYMHTMVEMVDLQDIERVGRLLAEFASRLDDQTRERMARDMMAGPDG